MKLKPLFPIILVSLFAAGNASAHSHGDHHHAHAADAPALRQGDTSDFPWWRGNLHTHSLWSDGDDYPEMIVDWYKENDYQFLVLSDHNILATGQKWINPVKSRGGQSAFDNYLKRFGRDWVQTREVDEPFNEWLSGLPAGGRPGKDTTIGDTVVRLKPLNEYRTLFEEPGKFLLIQSEEISDHKTIHVNATNLVEHIAPQRGDTVVETMQNNVNAVLAQRARTGQAMFPHINHPNFKWAITAEELAQVERMQFFEVYNGHPSVHNYGDETHVGTERMWDIILTQRLGESDKGVVYGLGTDDSHNYHGAHGPGTASSGKAWVVVRAAHLSPEHIIHAMEAGDFYSSTGVELHDVRYDGKELSLEIEPDEGATYVTKFIGTRRGYDSASSPVLDAEGNPLAVTQRYSDDVGEVLAEVEGLAASYQLQGDEIYVRAKVFSSLPMANPYEVDSKQAAWVQPVTPVTGAK